MSRTSDCKQDVSGDYHRRRPLPKSHLLIPGSRMPCQGTSLHIIPSEKHLAQMLNRFGLTTSFGNRWIWCVKFVLLLLLSFFPGHVKRIGADLPTICTPSLIHGTAWYAHSVIELRDVFCCRLWFASGYRCCRFYLVQWSSLARTMFLSALEIQ